MTTISYPPVQTTNPDNVEHRKQLAIKANSLNQGKFNCTLEVTLAVNAISTTITDSRIGISSLIIMMPVTSHAAQDISSGTLYIPEATMLNGSCIIQHQSNAFTDRNFRIGIIG